MTSQRLKTLLVLLGIPSLLHAKVTMTFNEAVLLLEKQNLELQSSQNSLEASRADQKSSQGNFLPNLDFSTSFDKTRSKSLTTTSEGETYTNALTLSQNIFNGFKDRAQFKIAESAVLIEQANLQEKKSDLSFQLHTAVADYFYAKNSISLFEEIKKRRKDNLSLVELRYESGRENKGSVLLSKAYLDQAELDLLTANNLFNNSITHLQKLFGLENNEEISISNEPDVPSPQNATPDFQNLINENPSTKKYQATLNQKEQQLTSIRSNMLPTWDIKASVAYSGNDFLSDDQKRYQVGTSLTWSLFNGGSDYYASTSALYAQKTAEKSLQNIFLDLIKTLKENHSTLIESHLAVKASQSFLDASKTRAEIARSKYNNGLMQFDDWDTIENELINRQKDYLIKKRTLKIAHATWEKSIGTGAIK